MGNFTILNGQVYTPGLAIVDAPQPNTPLGGGKPTQTPPGKKVSTRLTSADNLQIAIDVSGNGKLPWPPSTQPNADTLFHNITLFLTSETLSHNFTISNGTKPSNNSSYVGPVLELEPSSTVKHVNWVWPECLVGNGDGDGDSARGAYNISMHQSFRWNGTDYYTVFDLPISVTNSISRSSDRSECAQLENKLLSAAEESESSDTLPSQPWVQSGASTTSSSSSSETSKSSATKRVGRPRMAWWIVAVLTSPLLLG